ncbi:MAG TPA: hypothetical protein VH641_03950 [Streptosporangiaceae bacterium]|jgi:hypothetical protein
MAELALALTVVVCGLWSGLLLMLTNVLHPMYRPLDGRGFAEQMRLFLPVARKAPANYAAVIGMIVFPVWALIALHDRVGGTPFVLTAIGLGLVIAGPLLVSNRLAEPNYDTILAWDPAAVPAGWERTRARYFALNWIRAVITWAAFVLFLLALIAEASR